jgi:hypothetical protein
MEDVQYNMGTIIGSQYFLFVIVKTQKICLSSEIRFKYKPVVK